MPCSASPTAPKASWCTCNADDGPSPRAPPQTRVLGSLPSPSRRGLSMKSRAIAVSVTAGLTALIAAAAFGQPAPSAARLDRQLGRRSTCRAAKCESSRSRQGSFTRGASRSCPEDRSMLVAERSGPIRIIRNDVLDPKPIWSAAGVAAGNELKWLALHPRFAANRLVYLSYPKSGERGTTLAVARGRFDGRQLDDVEEIFVADAWETGGNLGGKILFGPDETLYVTIGDRDRLCCTGTEDNSLRMKAQDLGNSRRQDLAHSRRRQRAARQSVRRPRRRQARNIHLRSSQRLRLGVSSRHRRALASRDRAHGRRRGQHLAAGPQLRLAARVDGAQLHGLAGLGPAVCARRHGQRAHVLGAVDQPVELAVLLRASASRCGGTTCSSAR